MARIELACLDIAGTTVRDDGAVERAFTIAAGAVGIMPGSRAFATAMAIVHETMGRPRSRSSGASSARRRRPNARTARSRALTPICSPQAG